MVIRIEAAVKDQRFGPFFLFIEPFGQPLEPVWRRVWLFGYILHTIPGEFAKVGLGKFFEEDFVMMSGTTVFTTPFVVLAKLPSYRGSFVSDTFPGQTEFIVIFATFPGKAATCLFDEDLGLGQGSTIIVGPVVQFFLAFDPEQVGLELELALGIKFTQVIVHGVCTVMPMQLPSE